jgi:hypothetical protein
MYYILSKALVTLTSIASALMVTFIQREINKHISGLAWLHATTISRLPDQYVTTKTDHSTSTAIWGNIT